jgi:hypothetical protein
MNWTITVEYLHHCDNPVFVSGWTWMALDGGS